MEKEILAKNADNSHFIEKTLELEMKRISKEEVDILLEIIKSKKQEMKELKHELGTKEFIIQDYISKLNNIYNSNFWKIASKYYTIREKISIIWRIYRALRSLFEKSRQYDVLKETHATKSFNPYLYIESKKPINFTRKEKIFNKNTLDFSVVMPVYNEESFIRDTLMSLIEQNSKPSEIIIVDGGSSDSTIKIIKEIIQSTPSINIILIKSSLRNIGKQRNVGIKLSKNEIIALCDSGCVYDKNYFLYSIPYFQEDESVDLVACKYLAYGEENKENDFITDWENLYLNEYLPSGSSMIIKKSVALECGLFPEYLPNTGEDTYFSLMYRRKSRKWIFAEKSILYWEIPTQKKDMYNKTLRYWYGDGINGLSYYLYPQRYNDASNNVYTKGIKKGIKQRSAIEIKKRNIKGIVVILSGVPITDSGGGQRGAQLACEFIRNNYKVFFVNIYQSSEEMKKVFFDIDYSLLELFPVEKFDIQRIYKDYYALLENSYIISEMPHEKFLDIFLKVSRWDKKPYLIYDYIDNWNSSLGASWYKEMIEDKFLTISDFVIASASSLQEKLKHKTEKNIHLVPNAVNDLLFNPSYTYQKPNDFPSNNKRTVLYIGALWGEWFDWDLVRYCALKLSNVNFVFIGEIPLEKIKNISNLRNIYFLGLKIQYELPSYLFYSDCTIIPFENDNIVKYVNPLKIYEYLAMEKPVVSMYYPEISYIPGVLLAKDYLEFAKLIEKVLENKISFNKKAISNFIKDNNWNNRVKKILTLSQKY